MSSIDRRVSSALVTAQGDTFWRYLEPLREFYRLANRVDSRSNDFEPMTDEQMASTLTLMLTELGRAKDELSLQPAGHQSKFKHWRRRLYRELSYERYGLEQHEVKVALAKLSREAHMLGFVVESHVGRNAWVRELEEIEFVTADVYGNPDLSAEEALFIYKNIVSLVEDCQEILDDAGSSATVIEPLKAGFLSAFNEEYRKSSSAVR